MGEKLQNALERYGPDFGVELAPAAITRIDAYYGLVQEHNPILHLVAPCSEEEFAVRHVLEALTLLKHLDPKAKLADVGTGAGLPSIPCLLVREDLSAMLIESKEKKTNFLDQAVEALGLEERAEVVNRQFQEADAGGASVVTCRAMDKMIERLPRLIKWSARRKMLLFGGPSLGDALEKLRVPFVAEPTPMSMQRSLFVIE